ncbi:MAG: PilZ domain-containing protein [Terriglobales bacterium]
MTLSSMVVSRDFQEVSVLECILGGLHMDVDIESEPDRARAKLAKSKIDALIIDCDLSGASSFLEGLQDGTIRNAVPLIIVSGSGNREHLESKGASFVFLKPISVEQAVHTLSAARNMILDGRLRYHRATLDVPVALTYAANNRQRAHLLNLSQGGIGVHLQKPNSSVGKMNVTFTLPGTRLAMKFQGEVAWQDRQGNAGIRFVQSAPRMKRELQLWLERQYFLH